MMASAKDNNRVPEPNGSAKIVWWMIGALFAFVMLCMGTGGKVVYDGLNNKIDSVDRRLIELEKIAMVRVPEHAMFAAQIAATEQRVSVMENARDGFLIDIKHLTVELNALRVQMASLSTTLSAVADRSGNP